MTALRVVVIGVLREIVKTVRREIISSDDGASRSSGLGLGLGLGLAVAFLFFFGRVDGQSRRKFFYLFSAALRSAARA